jgi:hypothetical protein
VHEQSEELARQRKLRIERASYEARHAERRYKAAGPVCAARRDYHWRNGAFHKAAGTKK